MNLLRFVINSGIEFANTSAVKRGIQSANAASLILFILSFITFVLYSLWYGWNVVTLAIPLIGISLILVIFLNRMGWAKPGRIWISLAPSLLLLVLSIYSKSIYYDRQEELDYYTFRIVMLGTCVLPWVIFSLREWKPLLLTSTSGLVLLMLHDPLHATFGVPYPNINLKLSNYYFTNIIILITFILFSGSLAFLKWISERNEEKNSLLIDDLHNANQLLAERNEEILAQSVEIMAQSDNLNANQEKLIDANKQIESHRNRLLTEKHTLQAEILDKNADLLETNSELIKHNNELRQFSYTISHNLRGPVASLLGLINLIDESHFNENDREIFSYIRDASIQLDQIIKDLNKIIDIRHDIFQIRQKISIEVEIAEIAKVLRRELIAHNVLLRTHIECSSIYSIKPMVHSILYNLMSNAIKYRSTERQPVIDIVAREDDLYYVLEVMDNGLGINLEKYKENIFKLYKRFHHHTEGKGLGLFLVKLQSEALGGDVELESEINRYAKFIVRLQKPENIERQVLYSGDHAEIFYDARINATGVIWKGEVTSDEYRSIFTKCLDFVQAYNTPNYISDMTHQGPVSKTDQLWMFEEILPTAIQNGLRKIAAIRADSDDPLVRKYFNGINQTVRKLGASHQFFVSLDAAQEWIRTENEEAALNTQS